ncbi:MAG: EAL domain-containing protein [Clostridia bacterium]|nr:EAL domain-containing protein [Clostridia bacterium]
MKKIKEKTMKKNNSKNKKALRNLKLIFPLLITLMLVVISELILIYYSGFKKYLLQDQVVFMQVINVIAFCLILLLLIRIILIRIHYKKNYETDPITNQINFDVFQRKVKNTLKRNPSKTFYIYIMHIPNFQTLNEIFEYARCNLILAEIGRYLNRYFNNIYEFHSRLYSDKFVIFSPRNIAENDIFMDYMSKNISKIKLSGDNPPNLTIQVGAYEIPKDRYDNDIYSLIGNASLALENVNHYDSCIVEYDEDIKKYVTKKAKIEQKMHKALKNGEFKVFIQPKHRTSNEKLVGCEALIRWQDPELGLLNPGQFIDVFEKNRFIYNIDLFVLDKVCELTKKRIAMKKPVIPISVNISPIDLSFPNFIQECIETKNKYKIPDNIIELEFTETVFVENKKQAFHVMNALHDNGFKISIDDFGKKYSSLNLILDLPVDTIKLDASFFSSVRNLSIVRNIVAMSRALGIITIAEGVETLETLDFLKMIGCNIVQGFYFSKPMPQEEFEDYMIKNEPESDNDYDSDYDRLIELAPTDVPFDRVLNEKYLVILHINLSDGSFILHPRNSNSDIQKFNSQFSNIDELSEFFCKNYVFEEDKELFRNNLNTKALRKHFKYRGELILNFRYLENSDLYSTASLQILRARSEKSDNIKLLAYMRNIDDNDFNEFSKVSEINADSTYIMPYITKTGNLHCTLYINLETQKIKIIENKIFKEGIPKKETLKNFTVSYDYIKSHLIAPESLKDFERLSIDNLKKLDEKENFILDYIINAKLNIDSSLYIPFRVFVYKENRKGIPHVLITIAKAVDSIQTVKLKTLLELHNSLLCEQFDSFMYVNITKDTFFYTNFKKFDENNLNSLITGRYSFVPEFRFKTLFKKEDFSLVQSLYSLEALEKLFDHQEINTFSNELLMQSIDGRDNVFRWTEIYTVCAKTLNESGDKTVAIYFRNNEHQHKIDEIFTNKHKDLYNVYSLFDFIICHSLDPDTKAHFLGGNLVPSNYLKKDLDLSFIKKFVFEQLVDNDSKQEFLNSTSNRKLKQSFENIPNYHCTFKGKNSNQTVDINCVMNSKDNLVYVYIKSYDNKE